MTTTLSQPTRAARLPNDVQPMLCTLVAEPFDDPAWLFEPKLDGLRVLCRFDGKRATIISRNDKPQDLQFPEIVEGVEAALQRPAILDGEVVCLDENGQSSFRALQQRFHLTNQAEIRRRVRNFPGYLYVFDLLHYQGEDLRPLPLSERKRLLKKAVRWSDRVRWTAGSTGTGTRALREACDTGGEGVVGKKLDSPYYAGRSYEWVKIKCSGRQEFVIGGFTDPQRSRVGLGALLVGYYDDVGKRLIYAGKVGTGYTSQTLRDLRARLDAIERKECPFDEDAGASPPRGPGVHWVEPKLVAEIEYAEWTQNDLLRQPRFEGLRMDKKAKQVRRERAKSAGVVKAKSETGKRTSGKKPSAKGKAAVAMARRDVAASGNGSRTSKASAPAAGRLAPSRKKPTTGPKGKPRPTSTGTPQRVDFTNVDKVMFPDAGITKGDLIHYYLNVADKLLPHLRDRPVTLERLPDGVGEGKPRFWQKNTPTYYPKWIPRIDLPTDEGKSVQYALVNDPETLAYLVNQGTITFHPYLSRVSDLGRPDLVVFDFDPGGAKFSDVVRIANTLHEILEKAGVESFPKTSGKSGLHVMVPWTQAGGFDEASAWAKKVAAQVVAALPDVATTERMKDKRRGRVYVDVIQNGPGKHVVPPYVVRATPGATVSTPLDWKEVTPRLDPRRFDVKAALRRFNKGPDPLIDLTGG